MIYLLTYVIYIYLHSASYRYQIHIVKIYMSQRLAPLICQDKLICNCPFLHHT